MTALATPTSAPAFDPLVVRADFPILHTTVHGKPLVYLDNGATTQKPRAVIDAISGFYERDNANIHRGVYELSQRATEAYEAARRAVAEFLNAADEREIIFTRGTTEAINLVASSWSRAFLREGDEVLVSAMEHHSNIVPWQMAADAAGARVRPIPMNDAGELLLDEYRAMLSPRVKMVAVNHVSNALGTINDVKTIAALAHAAGAAVLVDGAQWVAHYPTDVRAIDADFYTFSGHKLFGPTGIGVLYGKRALLDAMPPYQGGGDMIRSVTFDRTDYAELPAKFEAGTPDVAGAVGLHAAIDYLKTIDLAAAAAHEADLLAYATKRLTNEVPGLRVIGTAAHKATVISFVLENPPIATLDAGLALDAEGIAVRTGHHCCQPVMDRFGVSSTTRASLAMYNTRDDVDALVDALKRIVARAATKASERGAAAAGIPAPTPAPSPAPSPAVAGPPHPAPAPPRAKAPPTPLTPPSPLQPAAPATNVAVTFPKASAPSPQAAADALADTLEFLEDHATRSQYVLDLGEKLPHTFDLLKRVVPRVGGCMSEVYLLARRSPDRPDAMEFVADANAEIVRGLIAVLQRLYSGQRAADVLAFDHEQFFRQVGLEQFVTAQRRNGLAGMINRIRAAARDLLKNPTSAD